MAENVKEEKKLAPVVKGKAAVKGATNGASGKIFSGTIKQAGDYVLNDVLKPAFKETLATMLMNAVQIVIFGKVDPKETSFNASSLAKKLIGTSATSAGRIAYGDMYARQNQMGTYVRRPGFEYEDIVYPTYGDADAVLTTMEDIISRFKVVSIADMFDLADVSTDNYQYGKYGWTDLRDARIKSIGDGFVIVLPKAIQL